MWELKDEDMLFNVIVEIVAITFCFVHFSVTAQPHSAPALLGI